MKEITRAHCYIDALQSRKRNGENGHRIEGGKHQNDIMKSRNRRFISI